MSLKMAVAEDHMNINPNSVFITSNKFKKYIYILPSGRELRVIEDVDTENILPDHE